MGMNETDRLRAAGVDAKKASVSRVRLGCFRLVKSGPTAHPRAHLPADPALVAHIKEHGIPTDERRFIGREDGDTIEIVNGCRRFVAGTIAEAWLRKHQPRQPPLEWRRDDPSDVGSLFVETEIVICSDVELILHRLDANTTRGLPDSKSVLAATIAALVKLNKGEPDDLLMGRVIERMPRGVTPSVVQALLRWENFAPDLRTRLDDPEVPIGLLVPIAKARAEDRDALLTKLLRDGVKTAKGATRAKNKATDERDPWARRMSPRQATSVAKEVYPFLDVSNAPTLSAEHDVTAVRVGIAIGLMLNGPDAARVVEDLPKSLRKIVQAARTAKKGARS